MGGLLPQDQAIQQGAWRAHRNPLCPFGKMWEWGRDKGTVCSTSQGPKVYYF